MNPRRALVTGGASGFGAGIARAFREVVSTSIVAHTADPDEGLAPYDRALSRTASESWRDEPAALLDSAAPEEIP